MPVDDPADRALPAMGEIVFRSPDGSRVEVNTDSDRGRRRYTDTWKAFRQGLEEMAARQGLTLIPVPTEEEIHQLLSSALRRLARKQVVR